jgi:hypothetical protein
LVSATTSAGSKGTLVRAIAAFVSERVLMGTFRVACRIENIVDRKKAIEIPEMLVDTGSELT